MRTVCGGQGGLLSWLGTEEQWSGDICGALLGSPTELGHGVTPELAGKSLHLGALVSDIVAWSVRSTGSAHLPSPCLPGRDTVYPWDRAKTRPTSWEPRQ